MPTIKELKSRTYLEQIIRFTREVLGIKLNEVGTEIYSGYCPFHKDTRDSLRVHVNNAGEVRFHCFGACKIDLDIYDLIQKNKGVSFREACRLFAEYVGVKLDAGATSLREVAPGIVAAKEEQSVHIEPIRELDQAVTDALDDAASFYNNYLLDNQPLLEKQYRYILRRGLDDDIIHRFQIGYAEQYSRDEESCGKKLLFANIDRFNEHYLRYYPYWRGGLLRHLHDMNKLGFKYYRRFVEYHKELRAFGAYGDYFAGKLTFPVRDINGKACGMVGRRLDNKEPRWILPSREESDLTPSAWLYGIDKAARYIRRYRTVILVEGIFDYFAMFKLFQDRDKPIVISTLGAKLTDQAAQILSDLGVKNYIVAYDWDAAGRKALMRVAGRAQGTIVYLGGMKEGQDPADLLKGAINAIDGFSLARLMEGTAKNRELAGKQVGFHIITCGPQDKHSLHFEPEQSKPVQEAVTKNPKEYRYRAGDFLPLLSYDHRNKAALDAKLTRILHLLNTTTTPAEDEPSFRIPYNFIADKRYEELGPGLIFWLFIVISQQQPPARRVKKTDAEIADLLRTSGRTISRHKNELAKNGYLEVLPNLEKRTQRISAKFFPKLSVKSRTLSPT